jgi:AhpD family alkylhydroperoxidase
MKRININTLEPQAFKAMFALEGYLAQSSISKNLKELIKIRASQINSCAYCIDMHAKDALKNGETAHRIFLLSAWREALEFFTEKEQVVLRMTEEITQISQHGLSDVTYEDALKHFTENEIAQIIMVIVTINSWNRIAVSTQLEVGK